MNRSSLGSLVALAVVCSACGAAPDPNAKPIDAALLQRFEARAFKENGKNATTLNYRLFKPAGATAKAATPRGSSAEGTNYPLVLFLHGAAGLGEDNQRQFNGGNEVPPLALTDDDSQKRFPCFVLAPQCPRGESWSGLGRDPATMVRLTLGALEALEREFRIDSQRLYLVGVSMGGSGAWDVAAKMPRRFAAVVPICGAGLTDTAKALTKVPIWCFHGAADPLIPVDYARRMVAAVKKAGGNPRYTEYPGVGHDSYRNAFKEQELLPWMFGQSLDPKRATSAGKQ